MSVRLLRDSHGRLDKLNEQMEARGLVSFPRSCPFLAQSSPDILRKKTLLFCSVTLLPIREPADVLLILTSKKVSVNPIHLTDGLYTQDSGLNALLLKKTQTPW